MWDNTEKGEEMGEGSRGERSKISIPIVGWGGRMVMFVL